MKEKQKSLTKSKETTYDKRVRENKQKLFLDFILESIECFNNEKDLAETTYDTWHSNFKGRITNFFTPIKELKKIMNKDIERSTYYEKDLKISEVTQFDIEDFYRWMYDCNLKRLKCRQISRSIKFSFQKSN